MKAAIIVLSDPKSGSDEALGRLFNALACAYDFKQRGDDVTLLFQGTATRWIGAERSAKYSQREILNFKTAFDRTIEETPSFSQTPSGQHLTVRPGVTTSGSFTTGDRFDISWLSRIG